MEPMLLVLMFLIPAFAQVDTSVEVNLIQNEPSSEILEKLEIIEQKILGIEEMMKTDREAGLMNDKHRDLNTITWSFLATSVGVLINIPVTLALRRRFR